MNILDYRFKLTWLLLAICFFTINSKNVYAYEDTYKLLNKTFNQEITYLAKPTGMAKDSQGCLYVAESDGARISKYDQNNNLIIRWGSVGSQEGQFSGQLNIAIDSSDTVYVADSGNNRIQKFDIGGNFLSSWGEYGTGIGQLNNPLGIAIDSSIRI